MKGVSRLDFSMEKYEEFSKFDAYSKEEMREARKRKIPKRVVRNNTRPRGAFSMVSNSLLFVILFRNGEDPTLLPMP